MSMPGCDPGGLLPPLLTLRLLPVLPAIASNLRVAVDLTAIAIAASRPLAARQGRAAQPLHGLAAVIELLRFYTPPGEHSIAYARLNEFRFIIPADFNRASVADSNSPLLSSIVPELGIATPASQGLPVFADTTPIIGYLCFVDRQLPGL